MALQISGASFALLYRRTNSKSIDSTEVWTTLADALAYAANTDDVKYVPIDGLVISVTENNKTYRLVPDESISTEDGKKHYKLEEIALAKDTVSKNLFSSIFGLIDADGNELSLYDDNTIDLTKSILAKFGLWTEEYLSALGMNPASGDVSLTLASLNDVLFSELTEGLSIVWNGTKWINQLIESGGLDESLLEDYLSRNNYATTLDITDAVSSKVDTTTFNSTISGLNTSISGIETLLETKASKDELGTAVSTINTRIDGVVTDLDSVDKDLQDFKEVTETELLNLNLKKLDVDFFNAMFGLMDGDGLEITPNSTELDAAASIKAKFGIWTNEFLSAKGLNPDDGEITGLTLSDLSGVHIVSPQDGESLIYQQSSGQWVNQKIEIGNPFYVWQGETAAAPTLNNAPAVDWTTAALKSEHVDDYYVTTEGLVYLFTSNYVWELVADKYLVDCWNKLNLFDDDLTERVEALEAGSATNILSVGVGNIVTDVTKSGTVITVNKDISVYTKSEIDTEVSSLNSSIATVSSAVSTESERAKSAESTITANLNKEIDRAKAAEQTLTTNLNNEISRAKDAELAIDDKISDHIDLFNSMFLLVTSDGVTSIKAMRGLWTDEFLSAKGANTNGGSSSGGGLIESLYRYADLGKTFSDTNNDTFNAYTINKINADLGSRISVLEGKATNVSFTQSLTSGTQIGTITIDGASKNIYAPTIPTSDINKGVTAYDWGNHANAGYAMASVLGDYLPLSGGIIDGSIELRGASSFSDSFIYFSDKSTSERYAIGIRRPTNTYGLQYMMNGKYYFILHEGNYTDYTYSKSTIDSKFSGLGTFAYKSSLAFADLTNKPTTIGGYGITDAYTKTQVDSALGYYLPLSGGTLIGHLTINTVSDRSLILDEPNGEQHHVISFAANGTEYAYLVATTIFGGNDLLYNGNTIIHSGNIGSQSVASAAKLVATERTKALDANALTFTDFSVRFYSNLANNCSNIPTGIAGWANAILALPIHDSGTTAQLFITRENNLLYFRQSQTDAWKGIAFLDSNVASATKLQTIRSIWGQSFDGTGNVGGNLHLDNSKIYWHSDSANYYIDNYYDGTNSPLMRYMGYSGHRFMTSSGEVMRITSSGNVGIGTDNPQYKLDVSGVIHSTTGIFSDGYVSAKGQNTSSDMRLKNVLSEVVLGVKDIANAPSVRFAWKNGGGVDVGSSAQYWQGLLPDAVKERDGMLEMQYANIALLSAIALAKNFETMEERVARLEREVEKLQHKIHILKNNVKN